MYRFATAPAGCATLQRAAAETPARDAPAPLLSVAQILRLVERRLAWYGLEGWRIKDVICNTEPSVTVIVRGPVGLAPARAQLALTIARDGACLKAEMSKAELLKAERGTAPRLAPAPQPVAPYIARAHVKAAGFAAGREYALKPAV